MRKAQAVKFWKEVRESTQTEPVVAKYKNKKGYDSARTLLRYVQANSAFKDGLSTDEVTEKTGWGRGYVEKIRVWWVEYFGGDDTGPTNATIANGFGSLCDRHRKDLLLLLDWLRHTIHAPSVDFRAYPADFGLENTLPSGDVSKDRLVSLGFVSPSGGFSMSDPLAAVFGQFQGVPAVEIVVADGNPARVRFQVEEEVIWQSLQQHLSGDSLQDALMRWEDGLLTECWARGDLNAAIKAKAEEVFQAQVTDASPPEARLTTALIWLTRQELTRRALGLGASDLLERLKQDGGRLEDPRTGTYLIAGLAAGTNLKALLLDLIEMLTECREVKAGAAAHERLEVATAKARRAAEEHLVRHTVPGRCNWCPTGLQ